MSDTAGIYAALPFCPSHCAYCSNPATRFTKERGRNYLDALLAELTAAAPDWADRTMDTLYLGGGTPTLYPPDGLGRIVEAVHRHFAVAEAVEITVEANPETLSTAVAKGLLQNGINRISIGAQSFSPRHLESLGRIHTAEAVERAVTCCREAGFMNLSLDLIFSLPDQQREEWAYDLERAISLSPDHIAAYGLAIEPGTPLWVGVQSGRTTVPDAEAYDTFYTTAVERLTAAGYHRYEVSNFAREGKQCRHNLRYWEGGDYLGVGAGSASHKAGHRYARMPDPAAYAEAGPGRLPMCEAEELSPVERAHEMAVMGLRTARGIDLSRIRERTGHDLAPDLEADLSRLADTGLIVRRGSRILPTDRGFLFNDTIGAGLAAGHGPER